MPVRLFAAEKVRIFGACCFLLCIVLCRWRIVEDESFCTKFSSGSVLLTLFLFAYTESIFYFSPVGELQYLQGLNFLTITTVEEILTHRLQSEQLDSLFAAQIQAAEGMYLLFFRFDILKKSIIYHHLHILSDTNELLEDTHNQIENIELVLKQIRSSVLDQIANALQAVYALQKLYNAQKSALFENSSNSSGNAASVLSRKTSTNECLDLLNTPDDSEVPLITLFV